MVPIGSRATRSSKPLYAPQKRRQCAARTAQSMRRRQPQIPRRLPTCFHAFARPVWIARGDLAPLSSRVRKRAYIGSRDRWIDDRSCRTSTRRESWRPFPYRLSATGFDSAAIVVAARRGARRGARSRYPLRLLAATERPSSRLCLYSSITSLLKLSAVAWTRRNGRVHDLLFGGFVGAHLFDDRALARDKDAIRQRHDIHEALARERFEVTVELAAAEARGSRSSG